MPNLPPPNTVPLEAREPAPIYQNLAVMYTPEDGAVTIIDKAGEEKKKLPPRPTVCTINISYSFLRGLRCRLFKGSP